MSDAAGQDLLEVVQQEQQALLTEEVGQDVARSPAPDVVGDEELRDRLQDERRVADGGQLDEVDAITEGIVDLRGHL